MTLSFEDRNSYSPFDSTSYLVTNEEPDVHRMLLKGKSFERALAIAAGGEISLLTVLPFVTKELVLIDHSYDSLRSCMAKAQFLSTTPAVKAKEIVTANSHDNLRTALDQSLAALPTGLKDRRSIPNYDSMRREWHYVPLKYVREAKQRVPLLKFIHGDIGDAKPDGPFDLVYISNAFEHTTRHGSTLKPEAIEQLAKPGAHVLLTSNYAPSSAGQVGSYSYYTALKAWNLVESIKGFRTVWYHCLYTVPVAQGSQTGAQADVVAA